MTLLKDLAELTLEPSAAQQLGLSPPHLTLRRAWPRDPQHLGLEYITEDGQVIVGQWLQNPDKLTRVAQQTARAGPAPAVLLTHTHGHTVLLQAQGADRRLIGLAPLLQKPAAHLIVHRPERRAVVRLQTPDGPTFAKVVRPNRVERLVTASRLVRTFPSWQFVTPRLLRVQAREGVTLWTALAGVSLIDLLEQPQMPTAAYAAGQALKALHTASLPAELDSHTATDEILLLQKWLDRSESFVPERQMAHLKALAATVFQKLAAGSSPPTLLHRDFYDKQIFVQADGPVGLLDFDTLAIGEPALDVANALVHLELRTLQGRLDPDRGAQAMAALIEGYQPDPPVSRRLAAYADATRLRLACVYSFRPQQVATVEAVIDRIGQPLTGLMKVDYLIR